MPLDYKEFAKKIKNKYPEYSDVDDLTLSKKMVDKYPEYKNEVYFETPLKKKEVSQSTPKQELTSSVTSKTAQKQPSVSSVNKNNALPGEYLYYEGKGTRRYDDGKWYDYGYSEDRNGKQVDIYDKQITDPTRVNTLNKHFGKVGSTSANEDVFTGYPGQEKNQYRVIEDKWQKKMPGQEKWRIVTNEGSIQSLNKEFKKNVSTPSNLEELKKKQEEDIIKDKKLNSSLTWVNSGLIGSEEDEASEILKKKFPGFDFIKQGALTDELLVVAPNGARANISLDNWTDEDDRKQSTVLREFIKNNSDEKLVKSANDLRLKESQERTFIEDQKKQSLEAGVVAQDWKWDNGKLIIETPLDKAKKSQEYQDIKSGLKESRKEYMSSKAQQFDDIYYRFKDQPKNNEEMIAAYASVKADNQEIKRVNDYVNDIKNNSNDFKKEKSNIESYTNSAILKLQSGEITQEEFDSEYKPEIEKRVSDLNEKSKSLSNELKTIGTVDNSINQSVAKNYLIKEATGSFVGGVASKFINGFTYLPRLASMGDMSKKDQEDIVNLITGGGTTKEYMESGERSDVSKALFSMSESLGILASSAILGGTTAYPSFYAQSYYEMKDELDSIPQMSETEKVIMSGAYGVISSALEKFGIDAVTQKTKIGKNLTNNIIKGIFTDLPKNASKEFIDAAISNNIKKYVVKSGLQAAIGAGSEGITESLQNLTSVGVKELYDLAKGTEYFNNKSAWNILGDAVYEGWLGALGGGVMSTVTSSADVIKNGVSSTLNKEQINTLINSASVEGIDSALLTNLKSSILTGKITSDEAKDINDSFHSIKSKLNSLPDNMSTDDKSVSLDLLIERDKLQKESSRLDEALRAPYNNRIAEINNKLLNISENAVQKQTTSEVSVQPETRISEEVVQGEPTAEPQGVTEEGQKEEVKVFEFDGKKYEITNESATDLETGNIVPLELATQIREEGTLIEEIVSKQEQKQNLVTQENVEELRAKQTTPVAQKIFTTAKLAMKALPGVKVYVHNTTTEFDQGIGQKSAEGSKGAYIDGEIHINLENGADVVTMLHESLHHGLVVKGVQYGVMLDLAKGLKSVVSDKGLIQRLDDFVLGYDASEQSEEYVAELGAIMAEAQQELSTTKFQQFKNLINKIAQKLGLPIVFTASANAKNAVDFMNSLTKSIRTGQEVYANDPGDGGEVGTFNIPKVKYQKAKSVSEDSRDFIREFVEDLDIREFNGQKFVTNMYDYTNAGETDLGNGFKINMLGGKNYVPLMMSLNGKKMGDISNLAAFNTKAQAETFIRNAQMGGAELFAPHSGTLSQSWQFQQHTFAELFSLVLDKGILTPNQLINTFNDAIKGNKDNQKEFAVFAKKYGENIKNFDSFESNPKKIIELLDIKNNYSPKLRKALNNAISANKKFQEAIGVKNKEEFYNRIMDPLNQGMKGGEIMNVVKFDPNTFEIVQTKESDINHHPSFGWTLLAKINGIYQPTNLYKSSNVTETYTKYNKDGAEVSRKAEEPKFEQKNVSSSAGAIPKVAEFTKTSKPKFQKANLTTDKDAKPGYEAALNALNETEQQREQWRKTNKVNQKQKRNPLVEQAVKDYFNEEITQEEYLETVAKNQPIRPFKQVPALPNLEEITNALDSNKVATGIIGLTKNLEDGEKVASRLDIPAYEDFDTWVVSIHDGNKEGKSIAYGQTAVLKNVDFKTFPGPAIRIAMGTQSKSTIARMFGNWVNEDPESVHARAKELMNDPAWTQVGMNPFRYSWFYDKADGMPLASADEVVQVGALVLAKNAKKVSPNDPMFETKSSKGGKIKFQKANTQQEAIQKAKEKYTLSVEERGNPHKQGVDAALNDLRKSDWYNTADDTQRENAERELKEFFGERLKKAPSVAKVLGKPKAKMVAIKDEYKAMITQIKLEAKAAREARADVNSKRKMLATAISGMVKTGKMKASQAAVLVKRISNLNLDNPVMVERFTNYAKRVFERADYQQRLDDAFAIRKSIRKLLKTDNQAEVSGMAKAFTKIDPSLVDDIDAYIEMADKVKNAVKPSRIKGLDVVMKEAVSIAEISEYTNEEIARQEDIQIKELLATYDFLDNEMSLEEMQKVIDALKDPTSKMDTTEKEKYVKDYLNGRFRIMSSILDTMFKTGVDPMTGEEITFEDSQKDLMKRVLKIDLNEMSTREAINIVESLENFLTNQITSGLEAAASSYEGALNDKQLVEKGFKAKSLKFLKSGKIGRGYTEQLFSLPLMIEKMFGGINRSIEVMNKWGLSKLINGVNKANKQFSTIVDSYMKQEFYSTKNALGRYVMNKGFMDAKNVYERGMLAFLKRNLIGTQTEMKAEFERRIKMIRESIDVLIQDGNSKEKKMGELYKEIYDKLNIDSMDMDVINSNASKNNLEAINWWINQWSKHYSDLSDISLSVYNTQLGSDLNYTPDKYKKLSSKEVEFDKAAVERNGSFALSIDYTDKNKSGVLIESTRPEILPNSRYVSLDFDTNNAKALKSALTDINTASAIRQIDGFMSSDSFKKLIPESDDRKIITRRINTYIRRAKGKNIVPSDTMQDVERFGNFVTALGVGKALGGVSQAVTQTVPVMLNTVINAGRFDIADANFNAWLDDLGVSTSNRGLESQSTVESIDRQLEASNGNTQKIIKGVENLSQFYLKQFLSRPDIFVARSSFKSYYLQNLKRRGISTDIDWKTHEPDMEAVEYAEAMVNRQQNVSDPLLAGEFLASDDPMRKISRKAAFPFASFILNQKARMYNDLDIIFSGTSTTEDKVAAARSLAGLAVELATFQLIGFGIRRLYDYISASLLGDEDDEETKKKKMINATKYPVKSIVNDIISPLPGMTDESVTWGLNTVLSYYPWMDDKEVKDAVNSRNKVLELKGEDPMNAEAEAEFIKNMKDEATYQVFEDENDRKWGMYGIALGTYNELFDVSKLATTGEFTDEYQGRETTKKLLEADREKVKYAVPFMIAYSTGLLPKDVGTISKNYINRIKKKAVTEKQYDRYETVQKDLGRNLKSWEIDMVKDKKESETAIDEIKFIERNGGLTERQGREYLKLMKAIGEPTVSDLTKIKNGQTADQILK